MGSVGGAQYEADQWGITVMCMFILMQPRSTFRFVVNEFTTNSTFVYEVLKLRLSCCWTPGLDQKLHFLP